MPAMIANDVTCYFIHPFSLQAQHDRVLALHGNLNVESMEATQVNQELRQWRRLVSILAERVDAATTTLSVRDLFLQRSQRNISNAVQSSSHRQAPQQQSQPQQPTL